MEKIIAFCKDYYVYLDILAIILILALVGYFVSIKRKKDNVFKLEDTDIISDMSSNINTNMSLQDFVNENKINSSNIKN